MPGKCNGTYFASNFVGTTMLEDGESYNVSNPNQGYLLTCPSPVTPGAYSYRIWIGSYTSTVACGQDMNRNTAYGIMGSSMLVYENVSSMIPPPPNSFNTDYLSWFISVFGNDAYAKSEQNVCLYFTRFGPGQNSRLLTNSNYPGIELFAVKALDEWIVSGTTGNTLKCPVPGSLVQAGIPMEPLGVYPCVNSGYRDKTSCLSQTNSMCSTNSETSNIGIGMSIGGIFLIIFSLALVVVLPTALGLKNF